VIDEKNMSFLIYKSSAGSGKTTSLIGEFLALSLSSTNPAAFKRILAITFTNKAASELKERFLSVLKILKEIDPETPPDKMRFEVQDLLTRTGLSVEELKSRAKRTFDLALRDYDEIGISTIDSFNHRLITSFSRDLRIKSDFDVELDEAIFFADAVERLLMRVGSDGHITNHLLSYLQQSIDEDKKANIQKKLIDLRPLVLSEEARGPLDSIVEVPLEEFEKARARLFPITKGFEKRVKKIGDQVLEIFDNEGIEPDDLSYKSSGYYGYFKKLSDYEGGFVKLHSSLLKKTEDFWYNKSASASAKASIEERHEELLGLYQKSRELFEKDYPEYALAKTFINQIDLMAVLADLSRELKELAEERNVVLISSFNEIISKSMRDEPVAYIYEKFGNRYRHILIDEFQDTSELQWKNVVPLVSETLALGNTSMVVGDAKQSIYRWRGGRAEQLIDLPELDPNDSTISEADRQAFRQNAKVVPLDTNYRSLPVIVEFNNLLIGKLKEHLTEVDSAFRKEYEGESATQKYPEKKKGGFVHWTEFEKDTEPSEIAQQALQSTQEAIADGYKPGDIAILVRGKGKEINEIIHLLNEHQIPLTTRDSFGLNMNTTVVFLVEFLRLAVDPSLTTSRVKVMREFCRMHDLHFDPSKYWVKRKYDGTMDLNAFLSDHKIDLSLKWLSQRNAFSLCQEVMEAMVPQKLRRDIFVETFLNCILDRGGHAAAPSEILQWWDTIGYKAEAKVGETEEQVSIMTIHKSKGLQFPVVILPNISWKFSTKTETRWLPAKDNLNLPFDFLPLAIKEELKNMGYAEEYTRDKEENRFDNLNLIYVALTRAAERLYIAHTEGTDSLTGKSLHQVFEDLHEILKDGNLGTYRTEESELESVTSAFSLGEKPFPKAKEDGEDESQLENVETTYKPVAERFKISSEGITPNREAGVLFHELAGQTTSLKEADDKIGKWLQNGVIFEEQAAELRGWMRSLYDDQRYTELLEKSARLAERTLASGGEILRPDAVFRTQDGFVVLDFKTGAPSDHHKKQVASYVDALSSLEKGEGKGYVVYVPEMDWVIANSRVADAGAQQSLF
jgi:ATP-dependent exoDNAse (exonuclease V) beta subunit